MEKADFLMRLRTATLLLAALGLSAAAAEPALSQGFDELGQAEALQRHHPELFDLLGRLELAHSVAFEELVSNRARGEDPEVGSDAVVVERLTRIVLGSYTAEDNSETYSVLGPRTAEIIRWTQAFQREVISILGDPEVVDHGTALADALAVYRSRPHAALPGVPKNMDVLYGHPYALRFREGHADLDGLLWAGHWLRLAATEPLTDLAPGPERAAGIDTVMSRYQAKLSYGEPPQFFPSELPLAPAISPGLIWLSPEAAVIWDNLSMLLEVLADVLASPETSDVRTAVEATADFFLDPNLAVTDQDEWEIMALRHGIFFQGGFPLAVMTQNERNVGGHAAHLQGGGMLRSIPGMPR